MKRFVDLANERLVSLLFVFVMAAASGEAITWRWVAGGAATVVGSGVWYLIAQQNQRDQQQDDDAKATRREFREGIETVVREQRDAIGRQGAQLDSIGKQIVDASINNVKITVIVSELEKKIDRERALREEREQTELEELRKSKKR